MILHVKCTSASIEPFEPELVHVEAVPAKDHIIWLPRQARWARAQGGAVFYEGEVYMEATGMLRDDAKWLTRAFIPSFASEPER